MKKRITAIIQARMRSTRLPRKIMKPLLKKPVLWHVINRVSRAQSVGKVIVATTTGKEDDVIYRFCVDNKILVFRGSDDDVLDRYYQCAKSYGISDILRITADCPLHDPKIIDRVAEEYLKGGYDYVSNTIEYTYPEGLDVEFFSFAALEDAWKNAELRSEREHVTPYIRNQERFKKKNVRSDKKYPPYKLSLDEPEDYWLIKAIYEGVGREVFYLDEAIKIIKSSGLSRVDDRFRTNEGYIISLRAELKDSRISGERIYLRGLEKSSKCQNSLFLGIFTKKGDRNIGNMELRSIDLYNMKATLNIVVRNKDNWSPAICDEALGLVLDYAFKKLNLSEISLSMIPKDVITMRCIQKIGFKIIQDENAVVNRRERNLRIAAVKLEDYKNSQE